MAHTGRRTSRSVSPFNPGEASPSFAQTGAEFNLDGDSDDDDLAVDDFDLRSEVGGSEAYEMVSSSRRSRGEQEHDPLSGNADRDGSRRMSATSAASFQLYTPDEEIAVRRKFDRKLVLFVALLFMLSFLDRSSTYSLKNATLCRRPPFNAN